MTAKQDEELLLKPEVIKALCVKHLGWDEPVSERDLALIMPLFEAQLAEALKHRLDRPELREKLIGFEYCYQWCGKTAYTCKKQSTCPAFQDKDGTPFNLASHSIAKAKADHNLALIPDIEESEARLELIRRLTARCEQLRGEVEGAVVQARKEQMVLDWAQAGKDIREAKKQAELDGYAKGFAEGVNKGTVIGEKQERERIIKFLQDSFDDEGGESGSYVRKGRVIRCWLLPDKALQALKGK